MEKLEILFFHDVICSYCFPMSYNMRRLSRDLEGLEIVHKSFPLIPNDQAFKDAFGSREAAKEEIVRHWAQANELDEEKRFNIEGMLETDFPFPSSQLGLRACKAAYLLGGEGAYWDLFDRLQYALYQENRDIGRLDLVEDLVEELGLDLEKWREIYRSQELDRALDEDLQLLKDYGINSVPTLIINREYIVRGVVDYPSLKNSLRDLQEKKGL